MSKMLVVLPAISPESTVQCLDTVLPPNSASGFGVGELLVVDNTRGGMGALLNDRLDPAGIYRDPDGHNLGVARSWNVGIRRGLDTGCDYIVLMSACMRFGPILHTTWRRQMETFWGETVIEADGHSWHLIAFHRRVFEAVGLFDENFYPAYFEAIDFGYRMRLRDMEYGWRHVWVNALSADVGHGAKTGVSLPAPPLLDYYREKWNGDKGEERYVLPFGSREIGWFPEHSVPELAEKYRLETWW
jgi:hypothetical protein